MKIVVCGSNFGRNHLEAIRADGRHSIAALVARGSQQSKEAAAEFGVPLVHSAAEAPDADIATVAVPGAAGDELAIGFLERGVPVLREHPVGRAALDRLLAVAAATSTPLHVNGHFADTSPASDVVAAAAALRPISAPLMIQLSVDAPYRYGMLDILGRVFGPLDLKLEATIIRRIGELPVATCLGQLNGVPVTMLLGLTYGSIDDGSMSFFGQQLSIDFKIARLVMGDLLGAAFVKRNPWECSVGRPPPDGATKAVVRLLRGDGSFVETFSPEAPQSIDLWARGLRAHVAAMDALAAHAAGGAAPPHQTPEYLRALVHTWAVLHDLGRDKVDAHAIVTSVP